MIDVQFALATRIMNANPHAYEALVVEGGTPKLARGLLGAVEPGQLEAPILAGLWLWHDGLEESHRISQNLHDATGSFWHAIMHRREGDFSNSKYWYARCAGHPVRTSSGVDSVALVDLVEEVHQSPDHPKYAAAVALQKQEWNALFDYCCK
jgi:hypothetical protein